MIFGKTRFVLKQGDITTEDVDAIVNAANTTLLGGGGVDGAIHRKGGGSILEECQAIRAKQGGCPTGEAVITTGGNLPARYVIHTVGPVWNASKKAEAGERKEDLLLRSAYENSLLVAVEHGAKTIAFPSISTGAYRFPIKRAARLALEATRDFCLKDNSLVEIRFVLFSAGDLAVYDEALGDV
jgi:O-acetyl-ADP-ribose deacetylase (regulator of RNase III)